MYSTYGGYSAASATPFSVRDILSWTEQQPQNAACGGGGGGVGGLDYPPPLQYVPPASSYPSPDLSPRHCGDQLTLLNASPSAHHMVNSNATSGGGVTNPACLYGSGASPVHFLQSSAAYTQHMSYSQSLGAALSVLHPPSPKDYGDGSMLSTGHVGDGQDPLASAAAAAASGAIHGHLDEDMDSMDKG